MKQILQDLKAGELRLEDVPAPALKPGYLLIRTTRSLISPGTERMLVEFAKANYLNKARQQPEKVRQVLEKVRTDGLLTTFETVSARLDQPLPMGYCNVGRVLAVGAGVTGFRVGDRVASNGPHAEVVHVPQNLCARIPDGVEDDAAAFTVISAIALQGVRLLAPTLGESVCVFGLGVIGLIAVQLLQASGARVLALDFDSSRVELARRFGATAIDLATGTDPVAVGMEFSGGAGIDGVLVTAATQSHDLMHQAAQMSRKRGRIVLTGVVGLHLNRADFYEKELTFQVSCSYGPGRYDPAYEEKGQDYPIGFVRWTEQRNFEAVLEQLRTGKLDVTPLVSRRVRFADARSAYQELGDRSAIGILLEYPEETDPTSSGLAERTISFPAAQYGRARANAAIALIGAGSFTQLKILPGLKKAGADLRAIVSRQGTSGSIAARKFGIASSTTDVEVVWNDPEIRAVVITTPHSSHAGLVVRALQAGKDVFVEKPLCLRAEELGDIIDAYARAAAVRGTEPLLMVGYNRRFSPLTASMREALRARQQPAACIFTCNAGPIPADHWTQDPEVGGGRIIGEACHFIDMLHYLVGSPITAVNAVKQQRPMNDLEDNVLVSLEFADGSVGQVNYLACGSKAFPKERCEVFYDGKVLALDNFRRLQTYGAGRAKRTSLWRQDKGHEVEFARFVQALEKGEPSPTPFQSLINVSKATFAAVDSMRGAGRITVPH